MKIIQPNGMGYYAGNEEGEFYLVLQFPMQGGVVYQVQESNDNVNWVTTQTIKFNGNKVNNRAVQISLNDGTLVRVITE